MTQLLGKTWNLLCSLKLAIVLASIVTFVAIAGSLQMPARPGVYGSLDTLALGQWLSRYGLSRPELSWWVALSVGLSLLLALNTLCCFIDWLLHVRGRWRKSGEYLIHLGFVLFALAFLWGSLGGARGELRLAVGENQPLPVLPGYSLRLDEFEPLIDVRGRPMDMRAQLVLLRDGEVAAAKDARTNHPLTYRGLVVVPSSFEVIATGFRFLAPELGVVELAPGTRLDLTDGKALRVTEFHPHVQRLGNGRPRPMGERLGNPGLVLELLDGEKVLWQGWYLLREPLPAPLREAGLNLRPLEPVQGYRGLLTVNQDPGAGLALAGGLVMTAGVLLAMISFYAKRSRGERPEVSW